MNVREQGPGGLLMLFASGATLYHLGAIHPQIAKWDDGGRLTLGLFIAALLFLVLGLLKKNWWRNISGFILATGLLILLTSVHVTGIRGATLQVSGSEAITIQYDKPPRPEIGQDALAAKMVWARENPYAPDAETTEFEGAKPYKRPAGGLLLLVPLAATDSHIDPRYVQLCLLVMTCALLGTALGGNFFFLPMLIVLSLPMYLHEVLAGSVGFAWLCFTAMAWVVAPQRYTSGFFKGLACATNPAAWFIAPFLLGITAREVNWKVMLKQLGIILLVVAVINGYWIYSDAGAWGAGVTADLHPGPKTLDSSIGLVHLEMRGMVGAMSSEIGIYWVVVGLLLAVFLAAYLFFPTALYAMGPVLGVIPFWAFFRSEPALFYFIPFLAIAGWTSARLYPPEERFVEAAPPAPPADA